MLALDHRDSLTKQTRCQWTTKEITASQVIAPTVNAQSANCHKVLTAAKPHQVQHDSQAPIAPLPCLGPTSLIVI